VNFHLMDTVYAIQAIIRIYQASVWKIVKKH
jgi:hypothetical protein